MLSASNTWSCSIVFTVSSLKWPSAESKAYQPEWKEKAMLYNLTLSLNSFQLVLALTVSMLFLVITLRKEKRDERKRA
jgi:hypothetical protein